MSKTNSSSVPQAAQHCRIKNLGFVRQQEHITMFGTFSTKAGDKSNKNRSVKKHSFVSYQPEMLDYAMIRNGKHHPVKTVSITDDVKEEIAKRLGCNSATPQVDQRSFSGIQPISSPTPSSIPLSGIHKQHKMQVAEKLRLNYILNKESKDPRMLSVEASTLF